MVVVEVPPNPHPAARPPAPRWVCDEVVCGRRVIGSDGQDLGAVEDLIPVREGTTWLLWVTDDDGPARAALLIPSDLVAHVTADAVYITRPGAEVDAAPRYDPVLSDDAYLDRLLRYYTSDRPVAG
jgi:hypothetical protein